MTYLRAKWAPLGGALHKRFIRHRRERGAAAVEFALIVPILILLVFGIAYFGLAWNAKVTLTHAAREGARAEAINDDGVNTAVTAAGVAAGLSNVSATTGGGTCSGPNPDAIYVEVEGDVDITIPLFWTGTITLTECATMRDGG